MKLSSLMVLALMSTSAFAGLDTDLLDLGGVGEGSSIVFEKDLLIPAGQEEIIIFKLEPGSVEKPGSKIVTKCELDFEPSPRLRKIPSGFSLPLTETSNTDGDNDYSFELADNSSIYDIDCTRALHYIESGKEIVTAADIDESSTGDSLPMTILDFNNLLAGQLKMSPAAPEDFSLVSSDRQSGKEVQAQTVSTEAAPATATAQ